MTATVISLFCCFFFFLDIPPSTTPSPGTDPSLVLMIVLIVIMVVVVMVMTIICFALYHTYWRRKGDKLYVCFYKVVLSFLSFSVHFHLECLRYNHVRYVHGYIVNILHIETPDGWMDDLRFYVLFNTISVISGQCLDYNEWLCAMDLRLRLRRFHLE